MELWQYNACVRAYNKRQKEDADRLTLSSWMDASLINAGMAGKLKPLKHYLPDLNATQGCAVTKEDQEKLDKAIRDKKKGASQ